MIAKDFDEFSKLVSNDCRMLSRGAYTPSGEDLKRWFRILSRYSLAAVRYGLDQHMQDPVNGRFAPSPADVVAKIEARMAEDGRPSVEEAWARSLLALDEQQTVVWSDEMAEAFAIARPLLVQGDKVGARMAFREVYARLVERGRANRELPQWLVSEGHDPELRAVAIQAAVDAGCLALPQAQPYLALPAPRGDASELGEASGASGGLPESVRLILMTLKQHLTDKRSGPSADAVARKATEEARAKARALVASRLSPSEASANRNSYNVEIKHESEYIDHTKLARQG
ncbi:hypothetical protein [Ideonella sp.]|uniref:hypothetical protein n=1 Tax=Ideonella sp. TaxID=1929293 RepID=UPI0035AE757A